ncbi:F-box/kelch-repeat protein At5g15710 [Physcomitrium patens]|uniref:F-box domain-containing protein n=1 Tax=Physcomitrium patens TaxID=3218 RepID=A0A2K1JV91_PHYPA|nr:F-box/kelch-repeat protein At5g15710-like [Physcomitrium patens]XP_024387883.1 F-box/kelch-repeat protein At5g15710-like [Physcomitrium patens]PNR45447.1 hypothetical protein PHYPA_015218 [Physcomitrium patens]|eukprot:XP_024387882.1 F-box/kelch-repeat protein At5g15710-like [Physcomitrella patens]
MVSGGGEMNLGDDCMEMDSVSGAYSASTDLARSLASLSVVKQERGGEQHREKSTLNAHHPYAGRMDVAEALDEALWSNLPEHLHDIILAFLPLPSFFRLRCVCKRWNEIVNSKNFLSICSRVPSQGSLFLMFADMLQQKCAAYDPTSQRWHMLPPSYFLPCPYFESIVVVATAGGLLCLEGRTGSQNRYLSVSNPMTRTQRKLPPMLHMKSPYVVGMVMDREHRSYKILVVQDGESLTSQVYDSRSNSWYLTSSLPSRVALITGTAFINGYLYSMSFGATTGVLAFDVNKGTWDQVKVKMPLALICPQLIGHRGQLLMVGGVEEYGSLRSVRLWRLDITRSEWVEFQCMPETLFNRLFKSRRHQFLCFSHGDYVCFTESSSREMLMYDMYRNAWWWLPVCNLNNSSEARRVLGFSFEPRLDALV